MNRLVTARLIAQRLDERDLPDLVALHLDPDVSRYLGGIRSAETTRAYLAANLVHWDRYGFGLWIWRTPDGAFVARAGIRPLTVEGVPEIEIAYALARGVWGRGYAGEIVEVLVEHALRGLALRP
jgi:RimJ/RimL family protein N-acetyltransferase